VVLGAGIAGLTAAHELIERGFQVTVYETRADERFASAGPTDGDATRGDHPPIKLGGLAASQFSTVGGGGSRARLRPFPGRRGVPSAPERAVPGEHGFRLFPAYYLHIWDLLQRIPLYELVRDGDRRSWRPTARTVMDNVRRVVVEATTLDRAPSLIFPREAPRSLGEMITTGAQLAQFGFTPADVSTFVGRLARYLVTSPPRRAAELADRSAYEFFTGDPGGRRYAYSPRTEALLLDMPRVLAAFDSHWGDARTNVTTYLQLLMHLDRGESKADGVLNGPTTEAWFDHWYRHLSALGVRFVRGEAVRLDPPRARPDLPAHRRPRVTATLADGTRLAPDYLIVAVDAPAAERITEPLRRAGTGGAVAGLDGFTTSVAPTAGPLEPGATRPVHRRDPYAMDEMGQVPWDRFQTLAGIQFYFDTEFLPVRGHVYYSGSDWSLSSISQQAMWERRPMLCREGFVSVLSVDIGSFTTPSRHLLDAHGQGKAAQDCTADELATEVWRQIASALTSAVDSAPESLLPAPAWYALDRNLVWADDRPVRNEAPYLVPIVGDWDNRPDGEPWNPNSSSWILLPDDERRHYDLEHGQVWRAGHGGYPVHHNSLVLAGTWTRTFTRLTSMEAACESARHAVNAVLDHYIWVESAGTDPRTVTTLDWRFPFDFLDQGYSAPVRQPTPAGDYCYVFDIENREPIDARGMRNLDAEYFAVGLRHPLDTLTWPDLAPSGGTPMSTPDDYTGQLLAYLQAWRSYLEQLAQSAAIPTPPMPSWPTIGWPPPAAAPPTAASSSTAAPPTPPPMPGPISSWPTAAPGSEASDDPSPALPHRRKADESGTAKAAGTSTAKAAGTSTAKSDDGAAGGYVLSRPGSDGWPGASALLPGGRIPGSAFGAEPRPDPGASPRPVTPGSLYSIPPSGGRPDDEPPPHQPGRVRWSRPRVIGGR
jgi:hypothetical protein